MRRIVLVLATVALLGWATPAHAAHDGIQVVTSTDFDAANPPIVGVPADISYYALEDGVITGHHNAIVALRTAGVPVATLPFTHEHDSIFHALLTPAAPGVVHADIALPPLDDGGAGHPAGHTYAADELLGSGTVHAEAIPLVPTDVATLTIEAPAWATFSPSTLTFRLADAAGEPLDGYVLATVFVDGQPSETFAQAKLLASGGEATMTLPANLGGNLVRATAWPMVFGDRLFEPVTAEALLDAGPPTPAALGSGPTLPPPLPATPVTPAPAHEHEAGSHLYLSTDPAPMNWVGQLTRANLIAMGEDLAPLRHTSFEVRVTDSTGALWFETAALHEADGMAWVDLWFPQPGMYLLQATATSSITGEELAAQRWFEVRAQGANAQPAATAVEGPEALTVGAPGDFTVGLRYLLTGESVPHTDYYLRLLHEGLDVLQTKIHTHQGDAAPQLAAPAAGDYELRVLAYPQAGGFLGSAPLQVLPLRAEGALPEGSPLEQTSGQAPPRPTPGFEALVLVAAAAVAILVPRRAR